MIWLSMSEKETKIEKKERDLNWIENLKVENRYLKLCYEFRPFIRRMKAAFYRPDYQNSSSVRWLKHSVKYLFQKTRHSLWNTPPNFWNTRLSFWDIKRKLKARQRVCVITQPIMSQSAKVLFTVNSGYSFIFSSLWHKLTVYIKYGNCFISKSDKNVLLQNVSGSLLQNATVLLQYVLTVIAKCDVYCKMVAYNQFKWKSWR